MSTNELILLYVSREFSTEDKWTESCGLLWSEMAGKQLKAVTFVACYGGKQLGSSADAGKLLCLETAKYAMIV